MNKIEFVKCSKDKAAVKKKIENLVFDGDIKYITGSEFGNGLSLALNSKKLPDYLNQFCSPAVLVIDDIEYFAYKTETQNVLCDILKKRSIENKRTVIISTAEIEEIFNVNSVDLLSYLKEIDFDLKI